MSEHSRSSNSRRYEMGKRGEQMNSTRQRIVNAAVALHGSVGPARTTIAGVAEQAGVTRLTVYRHFPDDAALFSACSSHWLSQQQLPDPAAWARHSDALERLNAGLSDLYRFYREGEAMLTRIYGDWDVLPAEHRKNLEARDTYFRSVLVEPFPEPARTDRLHAVVGHAVSFWTWRSLCHDNGLPNNDAVEAMSALITSMAGTPLAPVPTGAEKAGIRTR
ncbi:TetR/AcrR family transcriptional regulator [Arthrobacter sp. ISL-48]|uniref:TetR/AcrR family transcriptional regulator n=1 Tax=Arthrobacter sp. ISL-48 TaxID=2819110 RepID=UPI001BEC67A7|nr:TetR/AcrR family transcriptional regulator [Arthrobacter sp. ISL-48]MBT2533563.1 TetR/AcrR family transcriptional regulator [Arthrobacter sp. ISL-48]